MGVWPSARPLCEPHCLRPLPSCPEPWLTRCKLEKQGSVPTSPPRLLSASLGLTAHPGCPLGPPRKAAWTTTLLWESRCVHKLGAHVYLYRVYTRVCSCICVHVCVPVYACVHTFVCFYVYMCAPVYMHTYVYSLHTLVCTHTSALMRVCTCMCVLMRVSVYTYGGSHQILGFQRLQGKDTHVPHHSPVQAMLGSGSLWGTGPRSPGSPPRSTE